MDFTLDNAVLAAAFKEGVKEAMADPEFRRQLFDHFAETAARYVYLSREELARMLGRSEATVARWAARKKLAVYPSLGPKQPVYPLAGVEAALQQGTIRARPVATARKPAAPVPLPTVRDHEPESDAPLRRVVIARG